MLIVMGFCLALAAVALYEISKGKGVKWWGWALAALWGVFLMLTAFFVGAAVGESEPQAAVKGGLTFGFLLLVFGVTLWRWVFSGAAVRAKGKSVGA